jgi:hypothetical protein
MKQAWLRFLQVFARWFSPLETAGKGLIGSKLAKVETSNDLFTFFHLARVAEEKRDGKMEVVFNPTGEAFRKLVTLRISTDERGIIQQMTLSVARSFVDDRRQGVYAADLVQTFLIRAVHGAAANPVQLLSTEIRNRSLASTAQSVITAQPLPDCSTSPSAAYLTYAGNANPETLSYGSGEHQVSLRNGDDWADCGYLLIAIS